VIGVFLCFRILLEHLFDGFMHQVLVLVAVVAQSTRGHASPDELFGFRVVQIHNMAEGNCVPAIRDERNKELEKKAEK
jgi:hypothetical protein